MRPAALQPSVHSAYAALALHSRTARHLTTRLVAPLRLNRSAIRVLCPRLARLLVLLLLVGLPACGPAPSDHAPSLDPRAAVRGPDYGPEARGTGRGERTLPTLASSPAPLAPRLSSANRGEVRPAPPPGTLSTDAARVTNSAPNARTQTAASPAATASAGSPGEQTPATQAQRQAWDNWYTAAREHPDVGVRLQALEFWAQQPSEAMDPVTAALVDEDEQVRTRAEELYDQQLTREATIARPVQE